MVPAPYLATPDFTYAAEVALQAGSKNGVRWERCYWTCRLSFWTAVRGLRCSGKPVKPRIDSDALIAQCGSRSSRACTRPFTLATNGVVQLWPLRAICQSRPPLRRVDNYGYAQHPVLTDPTAVQDDGWRQGTYCPTPALPGKTHAWALSVPLCRERPGRICVARVGGHLCGPGVLYRPSLAASDHRRVPLLHGSGTRFKILEALTCGTQVVSTVLGAQGIDLVAGEGAMLADLPPDFTSTVAEPLGDGQAREQEAKGGLRVLDQGYGSGANTARIPQLVEARAPLAVTGS
jgi:hypothetical protein